MNASATFVTFTVVEMVFATVHAVNGNTEREHMALLGAILFAVLALVFKEDRK